MAALSTSCTGCKWLSCYLDENLLYAYYALRRNRENFGDIKSFTSFTTFGR